LLRVYPVFKEPPCAFSTKRAVRLSYAWWS